MSHTIFPAAIRMAACVAAMAAIPAAAAAQLVPGGAGDSTLASEARTASAAQSPLTLDSLYALVEARSPRIRAATALAHAAASRIASAGLPADPEVQLGLMNYMLPSLDPDPATGMKQLQVMQMVPLPGKLSAARRAAAARADATSARAAEASANARAAAAMAFYERYEAERRAVLAAETRRLLDDVAGVAGAMYRVGAGRQADVLRARVEIARMDEEVVRMLAMRDAATARLAAAADVAPAAVAGTSVLPQFPEAVPDIPHLVALAFAERPMLAAGDADLRAASAASDLARRERWPDLQVGVQYGQRTMDGATARMGSVMVGASLPIFAGARQQRMVDEAAAMQAMSAAELEGMRAETRGRIAELHASLTSARRLAALYRTTVLPQAEAATASSLASYRTGGVDFMTVVENRMSVNRYRQELVALEAAEGRAWAELETIVGQPFVSRAATAPRRTGDQ